MAVPSLSRIADLREDYARAGMLMLPQEMRRAMTFRQILVCTTALIPLSWHLPCWHGQSYVVSALLLGLGFLHFLIELHSIALRLCQTVAPRF